MSSQETRVERLVENLFSPFGDILSVLRASLYIMYALIVKFKTKS